MVSPQTVDQATAFTLDSLQFRNYHSQSPTFQALSLTIPPAPSTVNSIAEAYAATANANTTLNPTSSTNPSEADRWDIFSLAPRKVTWDIERDLRRELNKLERRTERACAVLLKQRLANASEQTVEVGLAAAVNRAEELYGRKDDDGDEV